MSLFTDSVTWEEGSPVQLDPAAREVRHLSTSRTASDLRNSFRVLGQSESGTAREVLPVWQGLVRPAHRPFKRLFDIAGALALGLVFLPVILGVAIALRWEGGPVLYRHRRIGRAGVTFGCLKFRSMVPNADRVLRELLERQPELKAEWLRDHKLKVDPRITAVGRFLRRTSLDELPQLWNVLRGDMSLVGPRPVVQEELIRYGRCAARYLSIRPGLTGLWQVTGRSDNSYRRRVALDAYYVRRQNALMDLRILLRTVKVVFGDRAAY